MRPLRLFRHVACEPPGYLGTFLETRGYAYEVVCLDEGSVVPHDLDAVAGLVFMGGPGDVNTPTGWITEELELIRRAADHGVPVMGICLGAQLMSKALGGEVRRAASLEVGWHRVERLPGAALPHCFMDLRPRFEVFQWHAHTFSVPPGATPLVRGDCAEHQAFVRGNMLAMQFHLEVMPEAVTELTRRYPGDLAAVSPCVQSAAELCVNLSARTARLHGLAELVFGRWLEGVSRWRGATKRRRGRMAPRRG